MLTRTLMRRVAISTVFQILMLAGRLHGQAPVPCPSPYTFPPDVEWVSTSVHGHDYLFRFYLRYGSTTSPFVGYGRYTFGTLYSSDNMAYIYNVWMDATCNEVYVVLPPYAQPQRTIVVAEQNWGYSDFFLNFTPPTEEDTADCFLPVEGIEPKRSAPKPGARINNTDCTGSGTGDGGVTYVTEYCLYYDYYTSDGVYMYSVLQGCWYE